jgi:hypothetical protein
MIRIEDRKSFLLQEIPSYHPLSNKYIEWWREQLRRCIEGFWSGGRWMPPQLYFYVNFGTIMLNKKASSKAKVPGRPFLRDLEWEFFYNWTEARGFSGFALDTNYTCARKAHPSTFKGLSDVELALFKDEAPNAFKPDGTIKEYISAREYLRKTHMLEYGRPLYENEAQDFMMMGSRGFGKSYSVGVGIVLHEWLFDGRSKYIPPEDRETSTEDEGDLSGSVMVGAGTSNYSGDILSKTKIALEKLPGSQEIGNNLYPCPFTKQYSGSWMPGKAVKAEYKKKVGSNWVTAGTSAKIHHRTFKDNATATNGLRCSVMVFEEIGMFDNLVDSRGAAVECQMNGAFKYGSMMFLGTGGDMEGGGTLDASQMFYDPESYNLLVFEDLWENKGKIGYFVPAYLGLNQYKDENGNTDVDSAKDYLEGVRVKLRKGKSSAALDNELQYRPLKPSEAFLTKTGNIFPIAELQERLTEIRDIQHVLEKPVTLFFDPKTKSGVNYKVDIKRELVPLNNFPLTKHQAKYRDGCVVVYEFPVTDSHGNVPEGQYIIGHDPYASDDPDGASLGSIYVLKTNRNREYGYSEIVASFHGRPFYGRKIINEILYKLSLFYGNAKIYFENVRGNVKEYFEKIKRLDLLATQPQTVLNNKKASWDSTPQRVYGYPMSNKKMKEEGILYIRDWLLEERGANDNGKIVRNLDLIPDRSLVQEMIAFNYEGNFDRVMAFMGCVIGLEETHNKYIDEQSRTDKGLDIGFITDNKRLFGAKTAQDFFDLFEVK